MSESDDIPRWFAMSAPFRNEMRAKALLDSRGVENFVAMCHRIFIDSRGRKLRKEMPAVSNLIFVRSTRAELQLLKAKVEYLQYKVRPENGKNVPIVVPDEQMQQFMAVCKSRSEQLIYLQPDEVDLRKGTPVRVVGGAFDGVEGLFVKVKGIRSRRVVISVQGLATVAMAEIGDGLIEVLEEKMIKT